MSDSGGVPIMFWWDGEAMRPAAPIYQRKADECFVIGMKYNLVEHENRSDVTHKHQFAWIKEAWKTLPEKLCEQFPTAEHLRKKALIECGFYNETITDCGTQAAALRVSMAFRAIDDFAHVVVRGGLIVRRTAKSQSRRAMTAQEFQQSKSAVLEHIAALLEVEPETLTRARSA